MAQAQVDPDSDQVFKKSPVVGCETSASIKQASPWTINYVHQSRRFNRGG
jgi:hypothetical protein